MRPTRILWTRKKTRALALAAASEREKGEHRQALARITGLAATVPDPIRQATT